MYRFALLFMSGIVGLTSCASNIVAMRTACIHGKPSSKWWMCFTALEPNSTFEITSSGPMMPLLEYSRTGYAPWKNLLYNTSATTLTNVGDKAYIRALDRDNIKYPYVFCYKSSHFVSFSLTGKIAASGDITSLLTKKNSIEVLPAVDFVLGGVFRNCSALVSAPELPSKRIPYGGYQMLFQSCTKMTNMPALPAKDVPQYAYRAMFNKCLKLETGSCVSGENISSNACEGMFMASGIRIPPSLAMTNVAHRGCYNMFYNCKSLAVAPTIPQGVVDTYGFGYMFYGCTNLSLVTTHQENFDNTDYWLSGVSSNGVFRCPQTLKDQLDAGTISRGASTVPEGWTVEALDE